MARACRHRVPDCLAIKFAGSATHRWNFTCRRVCNRERSGPPHLLVDNDGTAISAPLLRGPVPMTTTSLAEENFDPNAALEFIGITDRVKYRHIINTIEDFSTMMNFGNFTEPGNTAPMVLSRPGLLFLAATQKICSQAGQARHPTRRCYSSLDFSPTAQYNLLAADS